MIGTAEVISTVSRRALAGYHRTEYAPGNVVVAAAGNIEHDRLVALLQRRRTPRRRAARAGTRVRRPLARPPAPELRFQRKDTEQYHVCLGAPASRAPTAAVSRRRCSTRSSAARRRRGSSRRSARSAAWRTPSTASRSQYTDTGLIGVYVGTREENLGSCVEICVEQIGEIAAGRLRKGELERAKESLKGRIVLSMESTSNRMSRLGKSLVTDTELMTLERIMAEIDAVDPDELAELAAVLSPSERLAAAGVGPDEEKFRAAVARASPRFWRARPA